MQIYNCHTIKDISIRQQFEQKHKIKLTNYLWYQSDTKLYFSIDCVRKHLGKFNSIFTDTKKEFYQKYKVYDLYEQQHLSLTQFKNSKVLILGAGPSTSEIDWDATNYDHIISCNLCYLNDKIFNTKLSMLYLNTDRIGVDGYGYINKNKLDEYLKKYNPLIVYNENQMGNKDMIYNEYINKIFTKLRFNGRIGIMPYLILYLAKWGACQIDIIGMDGYQGYQVPVYHSFLGKSVVAKGSLDDAMSWDNVICAYQRQYIMFFDYLFHDLHFLNKIKIINLAEGLSYNRLTGLLGEFQNNCV